MKRLESALKAFGSGFHVYQYLFKSNRPDIPRARFANSNRSSPTSLSSLARGLLRVIVTTAILPARPSTSPLFPAA